MLCVLVVVAVVIAVSCIGYEINSKSAEQDISANGARFEPLADAELDQPTVSTSRTPAPEDASSGSNSTVQDPLGLKELKETPFNDYGYRFIEARIFFVETTPEVKYARPIDRVSKADIGLIHQGYDIWVSYTYHFTSITQKELDAIAVEYVLFMPNNEYTVYPDGTLGDGRRIEYDQGVMPSISNFFENYQSWPSGRYSLCLLLNGKYAGESQFEILGNQNE